MLALYRRHRQNCKGNHPQNGRTSEYDERKKGWKRCECPISISGTLSGAFKRHNTGKWEWEDAQAVAAKFEVCGSWKAQTPGLPEPIVFPVASTPGPTTIGEAVKAYLAHHEGTNVGHSTMGKYRTFAK